MWSFYFTILVMGIIPAVYMETCPDEEQVYPCSCKEFEYPDIKVTCSRGFFNTLNPLKTLRQSLSELTGKSGIILYLEGFNISIPSNFFAGFGIESLEFHSCRIHNVTNDGQPALLGLENHLESLGIYDTSTFPEKLDLGHLKKLGLISLYRNNITELRDDWLGNVPPSLRRLDITGNNITKLGSHAFSQLNDLTYLELNDNRFGPIKRSMFPTTARRLRELYLKNNGFTDLPVDIFKRMPAIDRVSLERNGITTLDERTWFPIWQRLSTLQLENTNIICDDKLKWILKSKLRPEIYGRCSNPRELQYWKRKTVEEFLKSLKQ